jgi:hypothetical protein
MQGMEFDSKLDSRQDYDILEVLHGKEIYVTPHVMKTLIKVISN